MKIRSDEIFLKNHAFLAIFFHSKLLERSEQGKGNEETEVYCSQS
jgi:hypothetical protein